MAFQVQRDGVSLSPTVMHAVQEAAINFLSNNPAIFRRLSLSLPVDQQLVVVVGLDKETSQVAVRLRLSNEFCGGWTVDGPFTDWVVVPNLLNERWSEDYNSDHSPRAYVGTPAEVRKAIEITVAELYTMSALLTARIVELEGRCSDLP